MYDTNETSWDDIEVTPIDGGGSDDLVIDVDGDIAANAGSATDTDLSPGHLPDDGNSSEDDITFDTEDNATKTTTTSVNSSDDITVGDADRDTNDDNGDDTTKDTATSDLSGIEQYLATFDIEGGMILFDDGTSEHFDNLDAAKQKEVLDDLHDSQVSDIADDYGLEDSELSLINYCRDNDITIQQLIENMADQRVDTLISMKSGAETNFDSMEDDTVFMKFLQKTQPEADTTKLEASLAEAKATSSYKATVDTLRNQFKGEQSQMIQQQNKAEYQAKMADVESQRTAVVAAARDINDIAGIQLTDTVKNGILDKVLDINEDFDSKFVEEALGGPEEAFKTAFWYYYGEDILQQRDDYWKKEKSAAYKRGMEDALGSGRKDGNSISFSNAPTGNSRNDNRSGRPTPTKPHRTSQPNISESWDDTFV